MGELVGAEVGSQAVDAYNPGEETELKKQDLIRGYRIIDMMSAERKVLIPGEKTREKAESQYGVKEVIG